MGRAERKASVSVEDVEEVAIAVTPPDGFSWPWDAKHRAPVWLPVNGSPIDGVEVSGDGAVRIRPDCPSRTTHDWLNRFSVNTGNYESFLVVGSHRYERWQLVWSAMTGTSVDVLRDSGLTVVRESAAQHDQWRNLKGLTTVKGTPEEELSQEDMDRALEGHCDNHPHRPWTRRSVDGGEIPLGKLCILPGGKIIKKKTNGPSRVSHHPSTGETNRYN